MCGIPIRDRSEILITVNAVFGVLALLALGIRLLVSFQQHIFGNDDICAIVGHVFSAPVTFGQIACGTLGFGKDTWAVSASNIYLILKARREHLQEMTANRLSDCVLQSAELLPQLHIQQALLSLHVLAHLPRYQD